MRQIDEYHQGLIGRFEAAAREFREACLAAASPLEPIEAGGWSVHQVAVHTRDVDQLVYGARARRTLAEDNPKFPNFDGEAHMAAHYDPGEALAQVLDGLLSSVQALAAQLREMPAESWSRESRHETQGTGPTLQTWVERGLEHIEEHLAHVRKTAQR